MQDLSINEYMRTIGSKGGKTRWANMSEEQRSKWVSKVTKARRLSAKTKKEVIKSEEILTV